MKNVIIFVILGAFFSIILFYILKEFSPFELSKINDLITANSLNPGEWDKLNNLIKELIDKGAIFQYLTNIAYLAFGLGMGALLCFITALHLFLDKLFFRRYYEKPSLFDALRRAILIVITLSLAIYMKFSLLEFKIILLVPLSTIIIEIIFVTSINPFVRRRLKRQKEVMESKEAPTNLNGKINL